jgi:FMN phosphatase YigB (HAD superfamily)
MIDTVLFDLGNTLVRYYGRREFPAVLERSLAAVRDSLGKGGLSVESLDVIRERAAAEDYETTDGRTRPLEGRIARIFSIDLLDQALIDHATRQFMAPIFELAVVYDDTFPVLEDLRGCGLKIGLVSNSPWGCPASLLHDELQRHKLAEFFDAAIFCVETGWRKPAEPIFRHALERLGADAGRTLFVGDDAEWDVAGPQRIGMRAALLDRAGRRGSSSAPVIRSLDEIHALVTR